MSPIVLEVDTTASFTKTFVGPVAWIVLEHLALVAHEQDNDLVADETTRSIAAAVSVSKDTAAGALRRLVAAGLAARRPQHRTGGRFGAGGYVLHLPPGLTRSTRSADTTAPSLPPDPSPRTRTTRPSRPQRHDQLTLLDNSQDPQP